MKEQSAVDFLHSKILFNIGLDDNDIFKLRELVKIAKKLEGKQHGKTWDAALSKYEVRAGNYMRAYEDFDDYYEEFVSKGSSEVELPKQETLYTEEQMREAIEHTLTLVGDNWSNIRFCLKADKFTPIRKPIEEYIQSLKQPKQ